MSFYNVGANGIGHGLIGAGVCSAAYGLYSGVRECMSGKSDQKTTDEEGVQGCRNLSLVIGGVTAIAIGVGLVCSGGTVSTPSTQRSEDFGSLLPTSPDKASPNEGAILDLIDYTKGRR